MRRPSTTGTSTKARLLAVCAFAATVVALPLATVTAPTPAAAAEAPATLVAGPKPLVVGSAPSTATGYTPVAGHFGTDAPEDLLWSGSTDLIWRGSTNATFSAASSSLQASGLTPLVGDFDGDHVDDVFWYGAGSAAEKYWKGTGAGGFTSRTAPSVSGTYTPVVGDVTGDGHDDIFWYSPGSGSEFIWKGSASGTFTSSSTSQITRTFVPVPGDFNGDGRSDIYWYAAGSVAEVLWLGQANGTFTSTSTRTVSGTYTPVPGDVDGNGRTDIYWYAPGSAAESLWLATSPATGFSTASGVPTVNGTYRPVAMDANGDSCSDIYWYASGSAPDSLFLGSSGARGCHPPATACPTYPGLDRWDWIGGDISEPNRWGLASNWKPAAHTQDIGFAAIPGQRLDTQSDDDYVCIPAGATPELLGLGRSANILVLENLGSLKVGDGSKLELKGKAPSAAVYVSHSHDLTLPNEATLFGDGELVVRSGGTVALQDSLTGTPAITTRDGDLEDVNSPLPAGRAPFHLVVAGGATLRITGDGINFFDRAIITNWGTTELVGPTTYIAADHGTAFENHGTFDFQDNGDYVQGNARPAQPLSTFTNDGLLTKTGGTGVSVIDATYTLVPPGSASVASGQISLFVDGTTIDPAPVTAVVDPGATLASGGCDTSPADCTGALSTSPDPQVAVLKRPASAVPATVTIDIDPPLLTETGTIGKVVDLTAASVLNPADPMIFTMTVDGATAAGKTTATMVVQHNGVVVPNCSPVPVPSRPCVNRPLVASTVGQPVTLEIWTTQNGRWRFL